MNALVGRAAALLFAVVSAGILGGCEYARMTNDEAVHTHEAPMPPLPEGIVPVQGGIERLRVADPRSLQNPLPVTPSTVRAGKAAYANFCIHCHGPEADGNGTVGQSFAPLPADLAAPPVRNQADGELFSKISLGYRRHPPLADTVSEGDRWAVIVYLRSLPLRHPREVSRPGP